MTEKRKKTSKRNRRRRQIRIFKVSLTLLVIFLPWVWLIKSGQQESEPMRVARSFANHMIHGRYDEARTVATGQSADDIHFYATWIGEQIYNNPDDNIRFKITHAQLLMPTDSVNVVYGKVLVRTPEGEERLLHRMELKMLCTSDGWLVDYTAPFSMW